MISIGREWKIGENPNPMTEDEVNQAEDVFTKAGISFIRSDARQNGGLPGGKFDADYQEYVIGKRAEDVKDLYAEVSKPRSQQRDQVRMGKLLGYPDTAIDAFTKYIVESEKLKGVPLKNVREKFMKEVSELPPRYQYDDSMAFFNFRLSKDHWKDEFVTMKDWANAIESFAPEYYAERVREYKEKLKREVQNK